MASGSPFEKTSKTTSEILPTPTYGTKGLFSVTDSITIKATAAIVLNALTDVDSWGKWNTIVPEVEIVSQPRQNAAPEASEALTLGSVLKLSVFLNGNGLSSDPLKGDPYTESMEVTVLEELKDGRKGYRFCWKTVSFMTWSLYVERVHVIVEKEEGITEYTSWATFGGPLAYLVKLLKRNQLVNMFDIWGKDLKHYVEKGEY